MTPDSSTTLGQVNLNLLRTLQTLLIECHVSRTASQLHITQSAVSRQLAQLRELFADPLLIREGNQLVLTPRAQQLKEQLNTLMKDVETLLAPQTFSPAQWQATLTLASSDYVAQYIFPEVVHSLSAKAPC
ncbi:LysR family transcriptional regulator [Dongshaea marina]|uniref:LysR family transcriptional regulator n=1 Tax=Dongshaea marina TaxID=2047966 RepID=UPI0018FF7EE2|nr:LysR family transcriptional regulator [Dongshaea marina]